MVDQGIREGYDMLGIDVEFKDSSVIKSLISGELVRKIGFNGRENQAAANMTWPLDNGQIAFAYSRAVIEHVPNMREFSQELARVLKPQGSSIHYFPSKYQLRECHTGVPLGALFQNRLWYASMCSLGLCFRKYRGLSGSREAFTYVKKFTFYRSVTELEKTFSDDGLTTHDISASFLAVCGGATGRVIASNIILLSLFRCFRSRVTLISKKNANLCAQNA